MSKKYIFSLSNNKILVQNDIWTYSNQVFQSCTEVLETTGFCFLLGFVSVMFWRSPDLHEPPPSSPPLPTFWAPAMLFRTTSLMCVWPSVGGWVCTVTRVTPRYEMDSGQPKSSSATEASDRSGQYWSDTSPSPASSPDPGVMLPGPGVSGF